MCLCVNDVSAHQISLA